MAQLVYATRFDVPGEQAWDRVVRPSYENWVAARYSKAFNATVTLELGMTPTVSNVPEGHRLDVRSHAANDLALEIDWQFPNDSGLIWRNHVRLAKLADVTAVEHRVEVSSSEYILSPTNHSVGAPNVIADICSRGVVVGEMNLRASVYPLEDDGVDQFTSLLEATQRRLPVVLLTPFANGDPSDIEPVKLAARLAGVAVVVRAETPQVTWALSERLGQLGCYDGGVRIYWPGFRNYDDLRLHPLLLGARISILGANRATQHIERSIFSIAAFRFVPDPRIAAIISASEALSRAARAQEVADQSNWESYAFELAEELDRAKAEADMLRMENDNLRANQSVLFSFAEDEGEQDELTPVRHEPKSVREAVDSSAQDSHNLIFLDSSRSSADDSPFKRPREIYEALGIMDKVASVWARNPGGGDLRKMLRDAGLGKRVSNFVSQTSKGKWADDYIFMYRGKPEVFEWHVTLGAGSADTCASIHFLPDHESKKLAIAHVGKHLTNTRS